MKMKERNRMRIPFALIFLLPRIYLHLSHLHFIFKYIYASSLTVFLYVSFTFSLINLPQHSTNIRRGLRGNPRNIQFICILSLELSSGLCWIKLTSSFPSFDDQPKEVGFLQSQSIFVHHTFITKFNLIFQI